MRKEAQDFVSLSTARCKVYFKNMCHLAHRHSAFICNSFASGRPEVVAKKFNIKMAKVLPAALQQPNCAVQRLKKMYLELAFSICVSSQFRLSSARAFAPQLLPAILLLLPRLLQTGPCDSNLMCPNPFQRASRRGAEAHRLLH
jgi:hypothetical protein